MGSFIVHGTPYLISAAARHFEKKHLTGKVPRFVENLCSNDWIGQSFGTENFAKIYLDCTRVMFGYYMKASIETRKDNRQIYTLVQVAAEKGYAEMQYLLGCLYLHDDSQIQKPLQGAYWWKEAAGQGNEDAIKALEQLKTKENKEEKNEL